MKKGWIVTGDKITKQNDKGNYVSIPVKIIGPRGCKLTEKELRNGHPFKMFDDVGNLYYTGFLVGDKTSEDGFFPLEHYGEPNAGCTYIQYKNDKGEWETL